VDCQLYHLYQECKVVIHLHVVHNFHEHEPHLDDLDNVDRILLGGVDQFHIAQDVECQELNPFNVVLELVNVLNTCMGCIDVDFD